MGWTLRSRCDRPQRAASVARPRLWSPDNAALYKATLTLADAHGRPLGGYLDYSGIRGIAVKNGRLLLNGRLLHLRGADLREQNIDTGVALTPEQTETLVGYARQLGATIIRAHYPVGPLMEELADRDGAFFAFAAGAVALKSSKPKLTTDPAALAKIELPLGGGTIERVSAG